MTPMDLARRDRFVRWIERGLAVLGASCLIWVGAIAMHAVTYQAEQNTRLAQLDPATDHLAADRFLDGVGSRQLVLEPDELWVLHPSPTAALTLITCYPFNFVGPPPRRFVVHAERIVETSEVRSPSEGPREDGVR
jgi:sortase family protein